MPLNRIEHLFAEQVAGSAPRRGGLDSLPVGTSAEERREAVTPINQVKPSLIGVAVGEAQVFSRELSNVFRDLSQVMTHIPDKGDRERFLRDLCTLVA